MRITNAQLHLGLGRKCLLRHLDIKCGGDFSHGLHRLHQPMGLEMPLPRLDRFQYRAAASAGREISNLEAIGQAHLRQYGIVERVDECAICNENIRPWRGLAVDR
jgi:hypothetical protein